MSQNIWNFLDACDLSGYTLIVPSVAVGNVGQLVCDLLISSLKMTKTATVYSPAFIPVLGYDPYDLTSTSLSGSCDLYQCNTNSLLVLQLRAPLVYKYAKTFLSEIVERFKSKGIKDIVVLTSSFAHEKKHILTSPFRYVANNVCPHSSKITGLNWLQHESLENGVVIPGGGFGAMLYELCEEQSMPCLILYKYCSEGDNIPDAYEMIHYLNSILPVFGSNTDLVKQLVQPVSWKLLYGRPPPQDIY